MKEFKIVKCQTGKGFEIFYGDYLLGWCPRRNSAKQMIVEYRANGWG